MPAMWAAAIGAAGSVASASMAKKPSAPMQVTVDPYGFFDHSGWTVATGQGIATASREETTGAALTDIERMTPWLVLGAVAVLAFKVWGKKNG